MKQVKKSSVSSWEPAIHECFKLVDAESANLVYGFEVIRIEIESTGIVNDLFPALARFRSRPPEFLKI